MNPRQDERPDSSPSRDWDCHHFLYHRLRQRPRGSALTVVLLVVFAILTLVMMTFTTSDATRKALLRSHDNLVGRQVLQFELAKTTLGSDAPKAPSWLNESLNKPFDRSLLLTPDFTKDLYKDSPSLAHGVALENGLKAYPGQRYVKYEMRNATPRFGVITENFPYAAMSFQAGTGRAASLEFESVRPWLNPLFNEMNRPELAFSGTAPLLMASGDVSIPDFPYGFLYQASARPSTVRLGTNQIRPVGIALAADKSYQGVGGVNPNAYRTMLRGQISELMSTQKRRAEAVGQSLLFTQYVGRTDLMGMFFSGAAVPKALKERLSLRTSQSFWLPSIPGIQKQYGLIWHLMFHVPAPPDGGLDGVARDAIKILETVMKVVGALEDALEALDSAQHALTEAMKAASNFCTCDGWPWNWPCCVAIAAAEVGLAAAKVGVKVAEIGVGAAESAVMVLVSPLTLQMSIILASKGQLPTPANRDEEARYSAITQGAKIDKKGADYWAYRQIFNGIGGFFEDLFTNPSEVGRNFGNDVNVVFFGHAKKKQGWNFQAPTLVTRATLNVPPGRSFHYNQGLTIQGDLWVGRGACCVIGGDLLMEAGDSYLAGNGGARPEGVVFLEEGATLIVEGKFVGKGTPQTGSVMVGGPIGAIHGITSALLVGRDADLPHGVTTGVGLDRLRKPVQGVKDGPVSDVPAPISKAFLEPLINDWGPNLAKVEGPFHQRLPYIARYATTFELITPPGIPMVLPMNFKNLHVTVFRGLTMLFAPTLNFELGENFMTHSDWWSGGFNGPNAITDGGDEGRVPVIAKRVAQEMCYRGGINYTPENLRVSTAIVRAAVDKRATQIGGAEVEKFANSLILRLLADILQGLTGKVSEKIPMATWGMIFDKAISGAATEYYNLDKREKELNAVVAQTTIGDIGLQLKTTFDSVNTMQRVAQFTQSTVTQECSGALIYSGGNLKVGSVGNDGRSDRTLISSGFFVSEKNMTLESVVTVGSAVSLDGTIRGRNLLYYPGFSHASIPLVPSRTGDWQQRGLDKDYGAKGDPRPEFRAVGSWRARLATEIRGGI